MDPNGEPGSKPEGNGLNGAQTRYIPPSRRRDKPQVVCNSCRRRKLKCDRGRPCDKCTRRGVSNSCTYAQNASAEPMKRTEPYAGVQDRIVQLENLVTTLMNSKGGANKTALASKPASVASVIPPPAANASIRSSDDSTQLSDSFGHINLNGQETAYADKSHWKAVLDEISDLKEHLEDSNELPGSHGPNAPTDYSVVSDSLLGRHESASLSEILSSIPPRQTCERLLAEFFSHANMSPAILIIHVPTFLETYETLWSDANSISTFWLAQFFAIICLASAYQQYSGPHDDPQAGHLARLYRTRCIQCLTLGQYAKGGNGSMEALLLYMQIEYSRSQDTETELWVLMGVIVRLALRMGYHRDPSHEPHISIFEGEMRRRRWAILSQFDIVTAAQFGLPRMIRDLQTDTKAPLNFADSDLTPDMTTPPVPRTEASFIEFWTEKMKLVKVFGKICELMASVFHFPYSQVMDLDKELNEAYKSVPPVYLPRPMSQSILDPPEFILGRSFMEILYQKTRCALHRKYMFAGKMNPGFAYSRLTAIDGALNVIDHQAALDAETSPEGRLRDARWKLGALVKHEFLLATTILCLYLNQEAVEQRTEIPVQGLENSADEALREKVIQKLSRNYLIWLHLSVTSEEAKKAVAALRLVLGKAQKAAFKGHEAIGIAMANARLKAPVAQRDKENSSLFTPPSSNASIVEHSAGQTPESMDLTGLPVVSSSQLIDPAEGMELFDMDTWDLGNIDDMNAFYDMDPNFTSPMVY